MFLAQDRCICLRIVEYSETSQIVTLLAREHGLLRAIAKGAHRKTQAGASKFGGGIDLLDLGLAVFTARPEKDLATLTEWELREGHLHLRKNLRALHLAFYAAELVSLLIEEHDPHPQLFDRLEHVLLELGTPRTEQAFLAFQMHLLRQAGYLPELTACAACGKSVPSVWAVCFAFERSGVVCRDCERAFPQRTSLDGRLLRIMQYVLGMTRHDASPARLPVLTRHQTDPINRLLAQHIQHTLSRPLRLASFVLPVR
jgi:DNA repair protein RecO (recombination protein O)